MSGGAYGYFSIKDRDDLAPYRETLKEIEQDMIKHCSFDVSDLRDELRLIGVLMDMAGGRFENIQHLLRTFEWWMSGDYNEDSFKAELEKWREAKKEIEP